MGSAPFILAGSLKEAHSFAREELGLGRGGYRVITTSGTLKSIRGADLYLVPGWERRFDRFAIQGALRWTRMNVLDVADLRKEGKREETPDDLEPPGVQLSILAETPIAWDTTGADPSTPTVVSPEAEELAEKVDNRRRRRCKDCGTLVHPDEVEQHAEDHRGDLFGGE